MKTRIGFVSNSSSSSFVVAFPHRPTSKEDLLKMMYPGTDWDSYVSEGYNYATDRDVYYTAKQVVDGVYDDLMKIGQDGHDVKKIATQFSSDISWSFYDGYERKYANRGFASFSFGAPRKSARSYCDDKVYDKNFDAYASQKKYLQDLDNDIDQKIENLYGIVHMKNLKQIVVSIRNQSLQTEKNDKKPSYYWPEIKRVLTSHREALLETDSKDSIIKEFANATIERKSAYLKDTADVIIKTLDELVVLSMQHFKDQREQWNKESSHTAQAGLNAAKNFVKRHPGWHAVLSYSDNSGEAWLDHGDIFNHLDHIQISHH